MKAHSMSKQAGCWKWLVYISTEKKEDAKKIGSKITNLLALQTLI